MTSLSVCYFLLCNALTYLKCSNITKFPKEDSPHRSEMLSLNLGISYIIKLHTNVQI